MDVLIEKKTVLEISNLYFLMQSKQVFDTWTMERNGTEKEDSPA